MHSPPKLEKKARRTVFIFSGKGNWMMVYIPPEISRHACRIGKSSFGNGSIPIRLAITLKQMIIPPTCKMASML